MKQLEALSVFSATLIALGTSLIISFTTETGVEVSGHAEAVGSEVTIACRPTNRAAQTLGNGNVVIGMRTGTPDVTILEPRAWYGTVDTSTQEAPQQPPWRPMRWEAGGQRYYAELHWRDDTVMAPTSFSILLSDRDGVLTWAEWSCQQL